ncbi:MAG: hypothetical protein OXG60_14955 [Chloroflexi bacterium]|nr:hypothetical protein [Chloroflexota bacterium]
MPFRLTASRQLRRISTLCLAAIVVLLIVLAYLFTPPVADVKLPRTDLRLAVWMGVTWSMDEHAPDDIRDLADELLARNVKDVYVYVSYLRADDNFNLTYGQAKTFVSQIKRQAPGLRLLAWVGVPVSIKRADGTTSPDRLASARIREGIALFSRFVVEELGFDGLHLNAEMIADGDPAYLQSLDQIRKSLPPQAFLSVTAHPLRLVKPVTALPYPALVHHWSQDYLKQVAQRSDQIVLMAYDSGLVFPRDYLNWVAYQTAASQEALQDIDAELLVGLPTSEEWTPSHQTQAETIRIALSGLRAGISDRLDGIAIYPFWETDAREWGLIDSSLGR